MRKGIKSSMGEFSHLSKGIATLSASIILYITLRCLFVEALVRCCVFSPRDEEQPRVCVVKWGRAGAVQGNKTAMDVCNQERQHYSSEMAFALEKKRCRLWIDVWVCEEDFLVEKLKTLENVEMMIYGIRVDEIRFGVFPLLRDFCTSVFSKFLLRRWL